MALTAVLTTPETSVVAGQRATFTLVLTNTGTDAVQVADVRPRFVGTGTGSLSAPRFYPETVRTIAGSSGTLTLLFDGGFASVVRQEGTVPTFGVTVEASTETNENATSNTISITALPNFENLYLPRADVGSLRFDSNNQARNYPVLL
jgi:hypothetical protein